LQEELEHLSSPWLFQRQEGWIAETQQEEVLAIIVVAATLVIKSFHLATFIPRAGLG
jgi:hypothetical protein